MSLPRPFASLLAALAALPTLGTAFALSITLHTVVLAVRFVPDLAERAFKDQPLEVILVNSKSARRPTDAQALAQSHLDGGGNTDEKRRAKTPLPPSPQKKPGDQLEAAQQRVQQLETLQRDLLTQIKDPAPSVRPQSETNEPQQTVTLPTPSGIDLASTALAMARLEGEISRQLDEYNKRPRRKFLGTRVEEYRFAQYVEDWRQKVERVGTLNYPEAARGKLYGNLVLTVIIDADGSVRRVEINRSSGHKVLDEAARRIVQMAGPYAPFPPDIRRDTDLLEITRTWFFTKDDAVRSQ